MLFDSSIRKELARSFGATLVVLVTVVMTMMLIRTLGQASRGNVSPSDVMLVMGFTGSSRTTRRAVARVRRHWNAGRLRVFRPWVTEPGMWMQYDFGDGPTIGGVKTTLFCAWLAWSRFPRR